MIDIQKFIGGIHEYLAAQIAPLVKRVTELEARPVAKDGKDADMTQVQKFVTDKVTDASLDVLRAVNDSIDSRIETAIKSIQKPVAEEDVQRLIDEAVSKAAAAIHVPKDGAPGRDAAHIEILPAINAEKAYPRGTYAKHAGGLWRSFEATDGMRGWECIVDGVADIRVESSGRDFTVSAERSSGAVETKTVSLPVMIYRGVFKEGQEYGGGDTVTWAGSLWHCDFTTSDKPGELGSSGWTLAAKRGRDGKDGTNGKDFTKAVQL